MSFLLRRARFYSRVSNSATATNLGILGIPKLGSPRSFSNGGPEEEQSFTVSYLENSLGLSPKAAQSASKLVSFKTNEKPDKVIKLLEGYGFTDAHIAALVRARPRVLVSDCEKTIFPKLEFLKSKGFSGPEMAHKVSLLPTILHSSLDGQIIPAFEFFRSVIHSEKKLLSVISRCPDLLAQNVYLYVVPNIKILQECGVSDSNIAALIWGKPRSVMVSSDKFRKTVERVTEMGFKASSHSFIVAISAFRSMTKSTWQGKVDSLKKWGWSDEEIMKAFKKHPQCMMTSLDKISATMDFFFREMGLSPSHIASYPMVINYSLEKRLIPRRLVIRALLSKGLLKKEYSLCLVYGSLEEKFLKKFVTPFKADAPRLMKLYEDSKLGVSSGLESDYM